MRISRMMHQCLADVRTYGVAERDGTNTWVLRDSQDTVKALYHSRTVYYLIARGLLRVKHRKGASDDFDPVAVEEGTP